MFRILAIEQVLHAVSERTGSAAHASGLRGKGWPPLGWLELRGFSTCSELAKLTCRRRSDVHRTLRALYREQLVDRVPNTEPDVRWGLTEHGRVALMYLRVNCRHLDSVIESEFGPDLPKLLEWLDRLREAVRTGRVTHRGYGFSLSPPPQVFRARDNGDH